MRSYTVTDVDQFHRYRRDEDFDLDQLLARLRRESEVSINMRAGTALHAILEHAPECDLSVVEQDDFRFHFTLTDAVALPTIRECRGQRVYIVGGEPIEIRGKVDAFGRSIDDHKLTGQFDAAAYADSYQWRIYLSIFGADLFKYNIFVGKDRGVDETGVHDWEVREFHALPLYRYPELESDVQREVELFAEFAAQHLDQREVA